MSTMSQPTMLNRQTESIAEYLKQSIDLLQNMQQ